MYEYLNLKQQMNALERLFERWGGSADHNSEAERLEKINLDDFDSCYDIIKNDLVAKIKPKDASNIEKMLSMIIDGTNDYNIKKHFQRFLVAVIEPMDEKIFARRMLRLIQKNTNT